MHSYTALATAIIEGDWTAALAIDPRCGCDREPLFSDADWTDAAQGYLDSRDGDELAYMLAREDAFQDFQRWQGNIPSREYEDFANWLSARWHTYPGALKATERRAA